MAQLIVPHESPKVALSITGLTATLEDGSAFEVPFGTAEGDVIVQNQDGTERHFLSAAELAGHWIAVPSPAE